MDNETPTPDEEAAMDAMWRVCNGKPVQASETVADLRNFDYK